MCNVEAACEIGWAEKPWPDDCPPSNAKNTTNEVMFRLVTTIPPTETDFLSRRALNPEQHLTDHSECTNVALSIWTTPQSCASARKFTTLKHKLIGQIALKPGAGVTRRRQKQHFSWWRCGAFDAIKNTSPVAE